MLIPLKQGLKPILRGIFIVLTFGLNVDSIKTRIETIPIAAAKGRIRSLNVDSIKTRIETARHCL